MRKHLFSLITALLCLGNLMTVQADTWTPAGTPASVFTNEWTPNTPANDMTLSNGLYVFSKSVNFSSNTSIAFKVCKNHDWSVAYPSDNYNFTIPSGAKYLIITYNTSGNVVDACAISTMTVAGSNTTLFGTSWAPSNTANDMTLDGGVYKFEKEHVTLSAGTIEFKAVSNHNWGHEWPSSNYQLSIPESGEYTVTITFDPATLAVNATASLEQAVVVIPTIQLHSNIKNIEWESADFTIDEGDETASLTLTDVAAGNYAFGIKIDGNWTSNGSAFTRADNYNEIVSGSGDCSFTADIPGNYTFTWRYADNTLSIGYPDKVEYVEGLIAAIGEVTLESASAINAARTAYDNLLSDAQQAQVSNYNVLETAEATYETLINQIAANDVKDLIDAIPNPVVYTGDCYNAILAARYGYNNLTAAQQALVGAAYEQKLAAAEAAYNAFIKYTVAGEPESLFGTFWDPEDTNNDMELQSNGTYKWEKTNAALAHGAIKFKIIKDHSIWEYPNDNYILNIAEDGLYTITIIYDPKAAEDRIAANATKTGDVVIVHTAQMKANWDNWTTALEFENINEGAAATATKILAPGTYEFKMIVDGIWLGEASTTFSRNDNNKSDIGGDEDNMTLIADIPGSYTFTWTYETNTLEIGYPNYIDANLAIDFRTNPYSVVSGDEQSASVMVEGTFNDTQHGYRLPVISIPVTAGNYLVKMGTCQYSNQDGAIKNEDGTVTYATLATNTGVCYHQNPAANYVAAIVTIPSDQIIKVYGAEYTPYFAIEKMAAIPAFTDFEINFRTNTYSVSGALPEGTNIDGAFHDNDHGYQNVIATVPVEAGSYRLTLGACDYSTNSGNVKSETNVDLATFNQKLGTNKCYHQNTTTNIVSMTFNVDVDQHITITCGQYTPYMKLEKVTAYAVAFALGDAEGIAPAAADVTLGEAITMPVNKTMYKAGYTLTGWTDGANTYAIGDDFTPTSDITLNPVFTANEADLLNASEEVVVKWYFGESNGALSMSLNGKSGMLILQATIGDKTVDVKLAIDATSGKFHNAGRADKWAQVNSGTVITFPYKEGMTVNVETYSGNDTYDLADGTLTCNTNDYYSYIELIFPAPAPQPEEQNITPKVDPQHDGLYYSTFYDSQVSYELPAGVEAYVATISGNDLLLTKIAEGGQVIPADNAVILKSTVSPYTLTPSDAAAVSVSANSLQGTDVAMATPAHCYVLSGADGVVGFYPYGAEYLNPHKAYVIYSAQSNAPRHMRFIFDTATDITNVQGNVQNTKVLRNGQLIIIKNGVEYNVSGQKVK